MKILISTWKPWRTITGVRLADRVRQAKGVNAGLCIKGTVGGVVYAPETWGLFEIPKYAGKSNDHLVRLARSEGIGVDISCSIALGDPTLDANAIHQAVARWNPSDVFIDAEGAADKKPRIVQAFLRNLGRLPARVWLQSFRQPSMEPELVWQEWLSFRAEGQYTIDGIAPLAFQISNGSFAGDCLQLVIANDELLRNVNRSNVPYFVTIPIFEELGRSPYLDVLGIEIGSLIESLEGHLQGLNLWRQEFLFSPELAPLLKRIQVLANASFEEKKHLPAYGNGHNLLTWVS